VVATRRAGPAIFGELIQTGSSTALFLGYALGAALMIGAGLVEAAGRELEDIAPPLAAIEAERERGEDQDRFTYGREQRRVPSAIGRPNGPA